ncbi:hypothetical protein ACHAXS_011240, partial [Conticribra weissflogii]
MSVGVLSMYPMTLLISLRPNVLYISEQSTSQVIFDDWPSTEGDASFIDFLYPPYRFVGKVWAGVDACAPTATPTTSPPSGRPSESPTGTPSSAPVSPTDSPTASPTRFESVTVKNIEMDVLLSNGRLLIP